MESPFFRAFQPEAVVYIHMRDDRKLAKPWRQPCRDGTTIRRLYGRTFMWSWWRHQMETFSALLAICAGNSPVTGEFPTQRPVMRSFDVFFDLCPHERLSKQSWGWWFGTLSSQLWRHRNGYSEVCLNNLNGLCFMAFRSISCYTRKCMVFYLAPVQFIPGERWIIVM